MWYFAKPLRDLRNRPIVDIADISGGTRVRVSGIVGGDTRVVTPLTQSSCSMFEVEMREWDNGATYPFSKEHHGSFRLRDDTGEAWIDPRGAAMALRVDERGHSSDEEVAANVNEYVAGLGRSMLDRWGVLRSLDWRERWLEPGDHVCVVGVAQRQAHPAGQPLSYRRVPSRVVVHAHLIADRQACRCPRPTTSTVRAMRSPWQTK